VKPQELAVGVKLTEPLKIQLVVCFLSRKPLRKPMKKPVNTQWHHSVPAQYKETSPIPYKAQSQSAYILSVVWMNDDKWVLVTLHHRKVLIAMEAYPPQQVLAHIGFLPYWKQSTIC